eukprot:CAMPEP_0168620490 /NCGR_PEP_ID=MMETSP0449_2-20121227/7164_1 /TAXON_ID=1082188 /ORGANISM="Strombidium rassoulzadegani, Strain ras09" /LENGTH=122 /DNA_ID=CAMNT_0008661497 /DNA_START=432 /DNA_END=797 /DNA_ORIENTATION=+
MSNGDLNQWDKVERGKRLMGEVLEQFDDKEGEEWEARKLEALSQQIIGKVMQNDEKTRDESRLQKTGYPAHFESLVSSIFLRDNVYRDCCESTICLLVDHNNNVLMKQVRYDHPPRPSFEEW